MTFQRLSGRYRKEAVKYLIREEKDGHVRTFMGEEDCVTSPKSVHVGGYFLTCFFFLLFTFLTVNKTVQQEKLLKMKTKIVRTFFERFSMWARSGQRY